MVKLQKNDSIYIYTKWKTNYCWWWNPKGANVKCVYQINIYNSWSCQPAVNIYYQKSTINGQTNVFISLHSSFNVFEQTRQRGVQLIHRPGSIIYIYWLVNCIVDAPRLCTRLACTVPARAELWGPYRESIALKRLQRFRSPIDTG